MSLSGKAERRVWLSKTDMIALGEGGDMNISSTVVRMCLSASLPDSGGFRRAYRSALSEIRGPLGWWIERGTNKEKLLGTYKDLDKYQKKALRVAVKAAMPSSEVAYRYRKSYSEPVKDWGGMSVTTNEELIRERVEYFGEDTVRAVKITPKDVMLHWNMDDIDTGALRNFESYDEQEVILKPDASPTEIPLDRAL
jgi:hypothetical protein